MNIEKGQINLYPLGKDKDIIIKTLSANENIKALLLPNYTPSMGDWDDVLKKYLYNRLAIPETQTDTKTYICVETYVSSVGSDAVKEIGIVINVFSHETLIELSRVEEAKCLKAGLFGNRVDCIIDLVDRCLNGKREMGIGRLRLRPNRPVGILQPSNKYYGKSLEYIISDFNTLQKI